MNDEAARPLTPSADLTESIRQVLARGAYDTEPVGLPYALQAAEVARIATSALTPETGDVREALAVATTPRGFFMFADFEYETYTNTPELVAFTVQESSAAFERKVWIGAGENRAHLTEGQARKVRDALSAFLGDLPIEHPVRS